MLSTDAVSNEGQTYQKIAQFATLPSDNQVVRGWNAGHGRRGSATIGSWRLIGMIFGTRTT